jgi:hypothetical protein
MEQETTQYYGRFNIRFQATRFVVMPDEQLKIRSLIFCDDGKINWSIHDQLVELYYRMLPQGRPCEMVVTVSDPLTRSQAESFNDSNLSWAVVAGTVGRFLFPPVILGVREAAGFATGFGVSQVLGTRHAGDILIDIQAWVNGGIGPQHSARSMLVEAKGGVTVR